MTVYDRRETFGRYFEDFQAGDVYKHWPGMTITEDMNTMFCLLTMNHQPLHFDVEYAKKHQHGQRVVVGLLPFCLAVGMGIPDTSGKTIAALDYNELVHHAPVFVGDTIYAESEVISKRESKSKPDRGIVHTKSVVRNQRQETVLSFKRSFMVPRKGFGLA
ncbi:MAG: MaoC family dehydratase [Chloroflexi bacterium]|nr:MaoC family dehydratase [Chloroflexota bacterium]